MIDNPAQTGISDRTGFAIYGQYLMGGTDNPTVTPIKAAKGTIYIQIAQYGVGTVGLYQKLDDGLSTNWTKFDSTEAGEFLPFEHRQLTPGEIAAKQIVLSNPFFDTTRCVLGVIGGSIAVPGLDYNLIAPNIITWNGLQLDGVLEPGDRLFINYPS